MDLRCSEDVFSLIRFIDKIISIIKLSSNFFLQFSNLNRNSYWKFFGNLQLLKELLTSTMFNILSLTCSLKQIVDVLAQLNFVNLFWNQRHIIFRLLVYQKDMLALFIWISNSCLLIHHLKSQDNIIQWQLLFLRWWCV